MMEVLLVSSKYPPEYSGSGHRAHYTYRRLAGKYGIGFSVVASSITANTSSCYEVDGVPVRLIADKLPARPSNAGDGAVPAGWRRIAAKAASLRDYLAEAIPTFRHLHRNRHRYDLIHVFGNVNVTSAAISYAKITKKPLIVELVNMVDDPDPYEPLPISAIWGKGLPRHALVVCISEHLRKVCLEHGYRQGQIWCRPNPIDETRFHPEPAAKAGYRREVCRFGEGDVLVLQLAKFMPLKNQTFILEAMTHLPDRFKLLLAGPLVDSGPLSGRDQAYFAEIGRKIRELGLEDRVQVAPGFVERPERYMKAADVFVMPSVREALGTPVLEALACGVPVVANDLPGIFDTWVKEGVNGYISPLDPRAWARKIESASGIGPRAREEFTRDILASASTRAIDEQYADRIRSLASGGAAG